MNTAVIAGIGEVRQGRGEWPSTMALHRELLQVALDDARLSWEDIDALLTVAPRSDPYLIHAAAVAEHVGITPSRTMTYEAGGAAPMLMIEAGSHLIQQGVARTVAVVAADLPLTGVKRDAYVEALAQAGPVHPDYEMPFGPSVPSLFALVARSHMCAYGTREDHLGAVAVQNRKMAALHPNAHMRKPMTLDDHLSSRWIAEPLRLLDCAPVSDGGGAVILTSRERTRDLGLPSVEVLGVGAATNHMHLSTASSLCSFGAGRALDQALATSDVPRDQIDVALLYDCFSIAMLVGLEDMGFVGVGESGPAFAEGAFALGSRMPVNPHGGLLSHGHPARAGGMGNVVEAVVQLRHTAGARQVDPCNVALVHGMGGVFATHSVLMLGRGDR